MSKDSRIPGSAQGVLKHNWHTNRDGESTVPNLSVEEARANMLTAREAATTVRGGTRVPKFIARSGQTTEVIPEPATRGTGGSTPVIQELDSEPSPVQSALSKINALGIPKGARVDLEKLVADGVITSEEQDALMVSRGITPRQSADRQPADRQPVAQQESSQPAQPAQVYRDEKGRFSYSIFKEKGQWVGLINFDADEFGQHQNERFVASSKDELLMKLLAGKAHATRRVVSAQRTLKSGLRPDFSEVFERGMLESQQLTKDQYLGLPAQSQLKIKEVYIGEQSQEFLNQHPEFPQTPENAGKIFAFLQKRGWEPTVNNLNLAYLDLKNEGAFTPIAAAVPPVNAVFTPQAPSVAPAKQAIIPQVATIAPRKRGTTGIMPGSSSASRSEDNSQEKREPTTAELKNMDIKDLKAIVQKDRNIYKDRQYRS